MSRRGRKAHHTPARCWYCGRYISREQLDDGRASLAQEKVSLTWHAYHHTCWEKAPSWSYPALERATPSE